MNFYLTACVLGLGFAALAYGIFLSLRIFNIPDITTDGSYTLGGAVTSVLLLHNIHPVITMFAAILCGGAAGAVTGIIHTRLNVNALLAGILVMTALYSVNLGIMGRSNIPLIEVRSIFSIVSILSNETYNTLFVCLIFAFGLLLLLYWLLKTDFGIAMRATGNSESMVRAMGVNTTRMKIMGLAIANGLTALSGFLITQFQGFSDINMGVGIVISGMAAVIIGESFNRLLGFDSLFVRLVTIIAGAILFRIILAAALDSGLNPNYLKLITAALVLLFVSITYFVKQKSP